MHITCVETISLRVPLSVDAPRIKFGGSVRDTFDFLLVRVDTDGGISGWGEAFSFNLKEGTKAIIDSILAPSLIGQDASQIAGMSEGLLREYRNSKSGPLTFGVSAIDLALWDIAGKAAELPLYRLFGGSAQMSLAAYASLPRYGDPGLASSAAIRAVKRGYRHIKVHEVEPSVVHSVRNAVGPVVALSVDASSAWSPVEAIHMVDEMASANLLWMEEPVWPPEDYERLALVAAATKTPIAAGENASSLVDLRHLLEAGALSYVQPSVLKIGGITEMRKAMSLAEAFNVTLAPHTYYLGPGLLASIHLIAAIPRNVWLEHADVDLLENIFDAEFQLHDGRLPVPQRPGLGFDPRPDVLERFRAG